MSALQHRRDDSSPWPEATSIGRWLHDVGNDLEDSEQKDILQTPGKIRADQPLQVNPKSHHYMEDANEHHARG